MQFQTTITQPSLAQSPVNDIERRRFLSDEEDRFAGGQTLANDVGDRLTFTGSWRADQHKILTLRSGHHGGQLRGIGGQWMEDIFGFKLLVDLMRMWDRTARERLKWLVGVADQVTHDSVLFQVGAAIDQVFPHQVFGEREGRQRAFIDDFKAGNITNLRANTFQYQCDVDAGIVAW